MSRPDLGRVRTDYQVADDTMIDYRPRAFGAFDIPFTDSVRMTRTEGALLDELTFHRGLAGSASSATPLDSPAPRRSSASRTIPCRPTSRPIALANGRATTATATRSATPTGTR